MKKFWYGFLVGLFLSATIALLAAENYFQGQIVYVIKDSAAITGKPTGPVITNLPKGTPLVVIQSEGDYVKAAISGYLPKAALTTDPNKLRGNAVSALMIVCADKASADKVLAEAKAGQDFAKLAKENSIDKSSAERGGNLGDFYPGDFAPDFENAILPLKAGQISAVVFIGGRYHIFKRVK